jgi:hypothetical protein
MDSKPLRLNKYSLLAVVYFFFNSVLLPKGLLFTNILSPVFFYNLLKNKQKTYWMQMMFFLLSFDLIHLYLGVDIKAFLVSNALFISTYVCVISFYYFVNTYAHLAKIFRQIVVFNACLTAIAIPFLFLPKPYQQWFWYFNELTKGFGNFPRLALFTYEASYYSLLLIPIWFYYLLKFAFNDIANNKWMTLLFITVPMLLSLSFGVIGATALTAIILCFVFWKRLFKYKRPLSILFLTLFVLTVTFFVLWFYFPLNPFFVRLENILTGKDTSANGRTIESFTMAWRIADMKNIFFGAGLGQIKIVITDLAHTYYKYWGNFPRYDIPNAMGETFAIFGIVGILLRLSLEIYLFIKTKVFSNYYRLALFIFIFIYQFTGSFITNIVEYVIWVLAFSNVFNQFSIQKKST